VANGARLPVTDRAAARVLTLPLWEGMTDEHVERLVDAVGRIRRFRPESPGDPQ
jgi:dTDP-4-amino-4,6-dideoxygalactose transaminase